MADREQRLALEGGDPAVPAIEGRGEPKIGPEEFMAVADRFGLSKEALERIRAAVEAEDWGSGPFLGGYRSSVDETKLQALERLARDLFGVRHARGVSSGTGALHAAFVAVGVGPGTEVLCPAIGSYAAASAVVLAGGVPVFCDVDTSLHMDPAKVRPLLNGRTVAVAVTHVQGGVADMAPLAEIAAQEGLALVEDCAQSAGARYRGRCVGTIGDAGCLSLSAFQNFGGGEGGLLLTDGDLIFERASQLADAGGFWRPDRFAPPRYPGELFCGTNYRMSELEAAVDAVQLLKVPATARRFNAVKRRITERLGRYREIVPQAINDPEGEVGSTLSFFPESAVLARRIVAALAAEGVPARTREPGVPDWNIYHEMYPVALKGAPTGDGCAYHCPRYRERGGYVEYRKGDCPVADDLFERTVTVPLGQWWTEADCWNIAAGLEKVLAEYCKKEG